MPTAIPLAALCAFSSLTYANPTGGVVAAGSATISESGSVLEVNQSSNRAVIDWRSFDIEIGETTRFYQPSSSAIAINRVSSSDPSRIMGTLTANGNVILINPNGVVFVAGSQVDVNGLVATTSDVDNNDFMAGGNIHFTTPGNPNASIINEGTISAKDAGLVGLVAPNVINSGVITAKLGKVQLASGDSFTLDLYGDGLMEVAVSDAVTSQLVRNTGTIEADGGQIALTAAAGRNVVNSLIEVQGSLKARSVGVRNGEIIISAEGANHTNKSGNSTVLVSGSLDVSGMNAGETGGKVSIFGDNIAILTGARINASGDAGGGTVLIGGDYQGHGTVPTSLATIVQSGTLIQANAITSGNGGKVIVWADNYTNFSGAIEINALGHTGDGGFGETSGKNILQAYGTVSATSRNGRRGEWLLDPASITINGNVTTATGSPNFVPAATASEVNAGIVAGLLDAGTNVTITTGGDAFAGNGDITVSTAITTTGTGSLTLSAYRHITVSAAITLTSGNITLGSRNANGTAGYVSVAADLTTTGGNIVIGGSNNLTTGYAVGIAGQTAGVTIANATLNAGSGSITIRGQGLASTTNAYGINLGTAAKLITTGSNGITLTGLGGNGTTGNVGIYVTGVNTNYISTASGNILLTGTGAGSSTGGYGLSFNGGATVPYLTTTSGTITLSGTVGGTSTTGVFTTSTTAGDWIQAGGDVIIKSSKDIMLLKTNITYTGSAAPNVLLQSDMNSATPTVGAIVIDTSNITTNGGWIRAGGGTDPYGNNTGAIGSATNVVGIKVSASTLNAGGASIWLKGTGYATGASSWGINTASGAKFMTSGTASVTLTGIQGAGTVSGIYFNNTTQADAIIGGSGGVLLYSGGGINLTNANIANASGVATNVLLDGQYTSATPTAAPIVLTTSNITTNGGYIRIGAGTDMIGNNTGAVGTSGVTSGVNLNAAELNAGGSGATGGDIWIKGTGYAGTTNNYGVQIQSTSKLITNNSGNITVTGTGGAGTTGNVGIYVTGVNTNYISTASGNILLTGTGAGSSTGGYGLSFNGGATVPYLRTTGGTITLSGTAGGTSGVGVFSTSTTAGDWIQAGGNVIIKSSQNISLTKTHITYSGSATPNVLLQSDMNSATPSAGAIVLTTTNITTNGGWIRIGGGTDPYGNSTGAVGVSGTVIGVNLNAAELNASGTGTGGDIWIKGTGYAGTTNNYGVQIQSTSKLITNNSGNITVTGTGGAGTTGNVGVYVTGVNTNYISTASGNILLTGTGAGSSTGGYGLSFNGGATVPYLTTTSGTITLSGTVGGTSTAGIFSTSSTAGDWIQAGGDVILKSSKNIGLTKTNITYTGGATPNVLLQSDMNSATPTDGAITLTTTNITTNGGWIRIGGGTDPYGNNTGAVGNSASVSGVSLVSSALSVGTGSIWIKGTGYATGTTSYGISTSGTGALTTANTGGITLTGIAGAATANGLSIIGTTITAGSDPNIYSLGGMSFSNSTIVRAAGTALINVVLQADYNVVSPASTSIISLSNGGITTGGGYVYIGGGTDPFGNNTGTGLVNILGATIDTSGTASGGNIWIKAVNYTNNASNSYAINLQAGAILKTNYSGTVTLLGTYAGTGGNGNKGIQFTSVTGYISTEAGDITLVGVGYGTNSESRGVSMINTSTVPIFQTTGGKLDITATAGTDGVYGFLAYYLTDFAQLGGDLTIKTLRGDLGFNNSNLTFYGTSSVNVTLRTNANSATPSSPGAIFINSSSIATNGGSIIAGGGTDPVGNGTGALGSTALSPGVLITNSTLDVRKSGGASGNIWIKGTGLSGGDHKGVTVQGTSSIIADQDGTITISGIGGSSSTGNSYGVEIGGTAAIYSERGAINITGVGGDGTGTGNNGISYSTTGSGVYTTGNGAVNFTATGASGTRDFYVTGTVYIGGANATGNYTFNVDTANWDGAIINTSGTVTFAPRSNATTIDIGGTSSDLNLTTAMLGAITRASSVVVGKSSLTGNVTLDAVTWGQNLSILTNSGNITAGTGTTDMNGHSFTATSTSGNITLPVITGATSINARTTTSGNISLGGNLTATGAGNAIVLASAGNFSNSGNYTLAPGTGRWIIYSTSAGSDTAGGLTAAQTISGETYGTLAPGAIIAATYSATQNTWVYSSAVSLIVITVTANTLHKTYGASDPTLTYSVSGSFLSGDSAGTVLTGLLSRTAGENVGSYNVTQGTLALASGMGATYSLSYSTCTNCFVIDPAALTIAVDNARRNMGESNPSFTAQYSGLTNGDSSAVVSGLVFTTAANDLSLPGYYVINASGATATNYLISYVDGMLRVKAVLPETFSHVSQVLNNSPTSNNPHADGGTDSYELTDMPVLSVRSSYTIWTYSSPQMIVLQNNSVPVFSTTPVIVPSSSGDAGIEVRRSSF